MTTQLWHQVQEYAFLSPSSAALVWLCVTLGSYGIAVRVQILCGRAPWVNPVLLSILTVVMLMFCTGTPYEIYSRSTGMIHFLLGPATVALAVPLAQSIGLVLRSLPAMILALLAGSITSVVSGVGLVLLCGGSHDVALSMAPKAVTTPIAIAITQKIGGIASLTAVFAIVGGIIAAMCGEPLLRRFGVHDWRAHGLAAGIAGSGIAAAQIAQRDPVGAAFAALGIGLNGLVTALLVPLLLHLFH
ncbi:MAG: LrgB family protein [Acetobacter sp.]|uniref:LrgB family protein n=1 Tax=Acetobacter sp. TaxID=440 RepID=UPI0039E93DDD